MKLTSSFLITFIFLILSFQAISQSLQIRRTNTPIKIDAVMDEECWEQADIAEHFNQIFPYDSSEAIAPTEVRMTYDDTYIYLIAIMHNLKPREVKDYVTPSLRARFSWRRF